MIYNPLISIITVVYNGEKFLEQTIQSVISQTYNNIEYIIIDGGSTDGTVDIIKKYEKHLAYWVSEKDEGIYDAMNKGLKVATGKYVAFINADDWYAENVLEVVAKYMQKSQADFIAGKIKIIDENMGTSVVRKSNFDEYGKNIHHQASFIKTDLIRAKPFNTKYRLAADRDMIIRVLKQEVSTLFIDVVISNFREGGAGSDLIKYQRELFDSNRRNIGLLFALKRFVLNITGRFLFNTLGIKR